MTNQPPTKIPVAAVANVPTQNDRNIWVHHNGKTNGPYTVEDVRLMLSRKQIALDDPALRGTGEWKTVRQIAGDTPGPAMGNGCVFFCIMLGGLVMMAYGFLMETEYKGYANLQLLVTSIKLVIAGSLMFVGGMLALIHTKNH